MRFTNSVIAGIAALTASAIVLADPPSYDHEYWAQYASADPEIDVEASLNLGPQVVYDGEIAGTQVRVEWNGKIFVYANDAEVTDLVVGEDAFGRPAFAQAGGGVSGFIDLDETGRTLVHLKGFSKTSVRIILDNNGVHRAANCNCFGTGSGGTITTCSDSNCDTGDNCQTGGTGTRHCRWSAATTVDLANLQTP